MEFAKKLGFGLMRLPLLSGEQTDIDFDQVCSMVDEFIARGFTYFDTAYMYHNGQSEVMAREALVKRHDRSTFTLTTKMPTMFLKTAEDMPRIFAEQCEKCGVDYFDYYLVHCLNVGLYEVATRLDTFGYCEKLKAEGKIKKLGFSFHDKAELLDKILTEHPNVDFVQLQINYLDWEDAGVQSRLCYEVACKHGKSVIVMEPVKGGTLANVPEGVSKMFKEINPELSIPSWAIRYAASLSNVCMVLSGMSNMEQLLDNTSYMQDFKSLNEAEQRSVVKAADMIRTKTAIGCTGCRYCTEKCPKNIATPDYFGLYNKFMHVDKDERAPLIREYRALAENNGKASECVRCGQCEKMCPQQLPVMSLLNKVKKSFESRAANEII